MEWQRAEISQDDRISVVDVPVTEEITYTVTRKNDQGELYTVEASSKLIAVKEFQTGESQAYIRTAIPDEDYDNTTTEKTCDLSLNCGDRGTFSGLELYSTLDGHLVAIAKYASGKCVSQLYLCDESLSAEEKTELLSSLFSEALIIPSSVMTRSSGVDSDDWTYGPPNSLFIGSDGEVYIYLDNDGDGISDSIIDYRSWVIMNGGGGGGSSGGGNGSSGDGGGSSGGGTGSGGTPGGGAVDGGSSGGGGGGNSSGGDSGDDSGSDDDGGTEEDGDDNKLPIGDSTYPGGGTFTPVNPLPGWGHLTPTLPPEEEDNDEYYTRLGEEAFAKIISDLESGNVDFYECTISSNDNYYHAGVVAANLGLNTNGLITSCINFMKDPPIEALTYGQILSGASLYIGVSQTIVAFTDGEISTTDIVNAISVGFNAIGFVTAFIPGGQIVSGVAGVTSCIIGLASNFITYTTIPTIIRLSLKNGAQINLLIAPSNIIC